MTSAPARRAPVLPERIGRYVVERMLGRGGQGVVLLARDHDLDRPVALKLLKADPATTLAAGTLDSEARIVSRLQHPNIVTLYDIGEYHRMPYLVFEYIDGISLESRITRGGALPFADCVILMSQILAGVAYLHGHGIVHRDLSPANILINADGIPKVTDFGLSVLHQGGAVGEEVIGTLRYMAPEPFQRLPPMPQSDVFTAATLFYEMLTGARLFDGPDAQAIIARIVAGPPIDASTLGVDCGAIVGRVLAIASRRDHRERYADAGTMKRDLDLFRLPRAGSDGDHSDHPTVAFLLRRMQHAAGFSALSAHISELLELTADGSDAPASRLVNIIAKDVTLTQRVLSMANSAWYGGGEITSLGPAVSMLGLAQVRLCVTSALLEQTFELGSQAVREAQLGSFFAAVLAKELAAPAGVRARADAFTCALFHALGRTLTIHYFGAEFAAIQGHAARVGCDELTASRHVLGIAYHELGVAVGGQWKLPRVMLNAMLPLPRAGLTAAPSDEGERLARFAAYANALTAVRESTADAAERTARFEALAARVAPLFTLDHDAVAAAVAEILPLAERYARLLRLAPGESTLAANLLDQRA